MFRNLLMFFYESFSLDGSDCKEQFRYLIVAKHQAGLQEKGKDKCENLKIHEKLF